MIFKYSIFISYISLITRWKSCDSFHSIIKHNTVSKSAIKISLYSSNFNPTDCVDCPPEPTLTPDLEDVTASKLRDVQLSDSDGLSFALGSKMGSNKSVVVFLRHLA